jgi:hypothetical protein
VRTGLPEVAHRAHGNSLAEERHEALSCAGRIGALALAATALIAGPAFAAPAHHGAAAVLVPTDDVHRNAIIAYDRAADGTLRRAGTYPTGGRGGILDGSVVDHLASQGSLA